MKTAIYTFRTQSPLATHYRKTIAVLIFLFVVASMLSNTKTLYAQAARKTNIISDKEILSPEKIIDRVFPGMDKASLSNRDDLACGDSEWVLADPGKMYFAYGKAVDKIGVKDLSGGVWELVWCDIKSGETFSQQIVAVLRGDYMFGKPDNIGSNALVYIFNAKDAPRPPGL